MNNTSVLNVRSEVGKLKTVLLHRPGKEIENLTPDLMTTLLFDDIPYLKVAREEHDAFARVLMDNNVEVLYLADLAAEAIVPDEIRAQFIEEFMDEAKIVDGGVRRALTEYFAGFDARQLIEKLMTGIRKKDLAGYQVKSLPDMVNANYCFLLDPIPNLLFTRDPFATVGTGITLNRMRTETRNREGIFIKYIFENHPRFKDQHIPVWFDRNETTSIEGGDILVLSDRVIAVGISQRTDAASVEKLAGRLFEGGQSFETVLAFDIPKKRAFMHLDTVFTMVDYDKFTIHADIEGPLTVFAMTRNTGGGLNIAKEEAVLEDILKKYLGLDEVTLIRCGGGDPIDGAREQWNDGSNTLAIAPGEVVVYSRNYITNRLLREYGIKVYEIPSSELSRGRGGPRCMSMPLVREDIRKG